MPVGTNVIFAPDIASLSPAALPELPMPGTDWLGACLSAYGAYTARSAGSARTNSPPQPPRVRRRSEAQAWLVEALITLDTSTRS